MLRCLLIVLVAAPLFAAQPPLVVHVTVALCDNDSQGIVPVPRAIGDGNDPRTNLYWGASFGVKSWLKREKWAIAKVASPRDAILERIVARKTIAGREVVLTADAWRGNRIRDAITSFVEQASGAAPRADVVAYVGHDGLMEFSIAPEFARGANPPRSIVLACVSRAYFGPLLSRAGSEPLLLTNGLMAPEAYTLTAAVEAYVRGQDVVDAAARAYHRYQNCGLKAARRLFTPRSARGQ